MQIASDFWDFRILDLPKVVADYEIVRIVERQFNVRMCEKFRINISDQVSRGGDPLGILMMRVNYPERVYTDERIYLKRLDIMLSIMRVNVRKKTALIPTQKIFCSLSQNKAYIAREWRLRHKSILSWFYNQCASILDDESYRTIQNVVFLSKQPYKNFFTQFVLHVDSVCGAFRILQTMHDIFLDRNKQVLVHMVFSHQEQKPLPPNQSLFSRVSGVKDQPLESPKKASPLELDQLESLRSSPPPLSSRCSSKVSGLS